MLSGVLLMLGVLAQLYAGVIAWGLATMAGHGIDGTRFDYPVHAVLTFLVVFFLWPVIIVLVVVCFVVAVPVGLIGEMIKKSS